MIDASSSPTTPFFGSFDFRDPSMKFFILPLLSISFLDSFFLFSLIVSYSHLSLTPPLVFVFIVGVPSYRRCDCFSPGHLSSPSPNPYIFITDSSSPFLAPVVCVSSPSSACHRHCHHCFKRPRLLLHGSIALISLFAPFLDFFPKKVRKAGDPGNHSFAIFPTVIILLWLLHENEVFDLVYDRSVNSNF
uniref:Uncharacterized protein n=1 Tax=Lactuca sativa TaxID=4236 RepID=A0A9R1XMW7_LACSA|nr:hypothetical protein LSAT_V11C200100020 [Lactuca sativa]